MEKLKVWQNSLGTKWLLPEHHCCFCSNCTDVFYDYTNGPYMVFCSKNQVVSEYAKCKYFNEVT